MQQQQVAGARPGARRTARLRDLLTLLTAPAFMYLAAGVVVIAAYFVSSAIVQVLIYQALGLGAAVSICVGVVRHRPAQRASWLLIAAGFVALFGGDLLWNIYELVLHVIAPFPSWADASYLAGYVLIPLGLTLLVRTRNGGFSRSSLLDGCIVGVGVGVLFWVFFMAPSISGTNAPLLPQLIAVAYPIGDVVMLVAAARLALSGGTKNASFVFLLTGLLAFILADVAYAEIIILGNYYPAHPIDIGWLFGYTCFAVAGLHPSMASLTARVGERTYPRRLTIALLTSTTLLAPIAYVADFVWFGGTQAYVIVTASALLFILVMARFGGLLKTLDETVVDLKTQGRALLASLSERELLTKELRHRALHDPLTGLGNRSLFFDRVEHALKRGRRRGGSIAVMLLDLDNFKIVNDSLGHLAGDSLLCEVANRLEASLRAPDTVARLGGDEFAVLLEEVAEPDAAEQVASRVAHALAEPIQVESTKVTVAISIGYVFCDVAEMRDGADPQNLLRNADTSMYVAKERGKGQVVRFATDMHSRVVARLASSSELAGALDRNEFELHFQPIVELATGRAIGMEALVRWRHPTKGLLGPHAFLDIADETGLILPLGQWISEEACAVLARLQTSGLEEPGFFVGINVSARQLVQATLLDVVRGSLTRHGLDPGDLMIEVTENTLMSEPAALELLAQLRALGVRIAIDDFGTGYSALAYLRNLPVDVLKMDKQFVADLPGGGALAQTIIGLADALDLDLIVEGIETDEQAGVLRAMGCTSGQGYLFARPMPEGKFSDHIAIATVLQANPATRSAGSL
jgi:diguanylate cyclase (GGDEF)-like protein